MVNPTNGKRLDNNQIFGNYETYNNYSNFLRRNDGAYYGWCNNGNFYYYWWSVGTCISKSNYRGNITLRDLSNGTSCWNAGLHKDIDINFPYPGHYTVPSSCFINIKGWH